MHRKLLSCAPLLGVALALTVTGCRDSDRPAALSSPSGEVGSTIINGTADTSHSAVVAVLWNLGAQGVNECTGTIVNVTGNTGVLLTAAHCVLAEPGSGLSNPTAQDLVVVQGNDWQTSPVQFPVSAFKVHPLYQPGSASSPYDFAMVTFLGAGPTTATIPPLSAAEDTLAVGTQVNLIGYGKTDPSASNNNSTKHAITLPLNQVTPLQISYSEKNGGTCQGDSGGPALVTVGGVEKVAGVSSFVVDGCMTEGTSGRVSAVYDWIQGYIDGTNQPGTQTCDQCRQAATQGVGSCTTQVQACFDDPACKALAECESNCAANDAACFSGCSQANPTGVDKRVAIETCICDTGCTTQCQMQCAKPTCGLQFSPETCNGCYEGACCAEGNACANDATCPNCFQQNPPAECATNAAAKALNSCLVGKCAQPCLGNCGFSFQNTTCGDCVNAKCATQCSACAADDTCTSCETSSMPGTECGSNALATGFETCISTSCSAECGGGAGGAGGAGGGTQAAPPPACGADVTAPASGQCAGLAHACNPVTNAGCDAAMGQACDVNTAGDGFQCYDPPNDADLCGACGQTAKTYCKGGATCIDEKCYRFCCSDAECGANGQCAFGITMAITDVGVCLDKTGGAGGAGGTMGAAGTSGSTGGGTGTAGTGTAGSGTAGSGTAGSGTAGSSSGQGGSSTAGAAGSGTAGGTSSQGGGTTAGGSAGQAGAAPSGGATGGGAGGAGAGVGGGKPGGVSGAAGSQVSSGSGGVSSAQGFVPPSSSDSGGCGCTVPSGGSPEKGFAIGALAALALLRRRRAAK